MAGALQLLAAPEISMRVPELAGQSETPAPAVTRKVLVHKLLFTGVAQFHAGQLARLVRDCSQE